MVSATSSPTDSLVQKTFNAYEYAHELKHDNIADLIEHRLNLAPYDQRFFSCSKNE